MKLVYSKYLHTYVHTRLTLQAYGVPRELLFEPEELLYLRNIPKVTRCLYALGQCVSKDN